MAVKRAATRSAWKWRLAAFLAVAVPGTILAQNRLAQRSYNDEPQVQISDQLTGSQQSGQDPFAKVPRAEIWHGNTRVTPAPESEGSGDSLTNQSYRSVAERMIQDALRLAEKGDIAGAQRLARWAKSFPVKWARGEHSPEWLLSELQLLESRRHNSQLEADRRLAQQQKSKKTEVALAPRYAEPDPLTARKSVEIEERLMVLEDAMEEDEKPAETVVPPVTQSKTPAEGLVSYLASFAGGALFTLIICSALVLVLFRKNSSRSGPVFRVELVNNANGEAVLVPAGSARQEGQSGESSPAPEFADPPPLEEIPLDLAGAGGSTYDEEIKRREQERLAREQAMLQFIYEKNVELRGELSDFERKAA